MRYGLLGEKLSHSFSPRIHGLLGCPDYGLLEADRDALDDFMTARAFEAINVTIPYKRDVMPLRAGIDAAAREIGCVNTIVNRGGALYGYNTDYSGFLYMADRAGIDFTGKKVPFWAPAAPASPPPPRPEAGGVWRCSGSPGRGELNYENAATLHGDAQILVNTTPVGMYPRNGAAAVDLRCFPALTGVLDVVYNPLNTALILQAKALGLPASGGLSMLVTQAVFAEELFFGKKFPEAEYERVLRAIDGEKRSIVLMGMPGCGKTTLGRFLARKTGRPAADVDAEIVREAGCSIPEIFEKQGETAFRDLESAVLARLTKEGGGILSLGGGSVLRAENRAAVAQNGCRRYRGTQRACPPTGALSAGGVCGRCRCRDPLRRRMRLENDQTWEPWRKVTLVLRRRYDMVLIFRRT
jgi:shikimate dehydrogenase